MADINVLMVGGRRAGKTSVLASMDKCCRKQLAGVEQLSVIRDPDSGIDLNMKLKELKRYFSKEYKKRPTFVADLQPSVTSASYGFDISVNDRNLGYKICFTDIPGEWISNPGHEADMQKAMDQSQVIIIAIDTPHLVEQREAGTGYGKYHDEFNRVKEITRFFKQTFQKSKTEHLVLFVPLKCEKYYYRNADSKAWNMQLVTKTVQAGYRELLDFLTKSDVSELCSVAIVPILTLGGAEFNKFDSNGYAGIYSYVMDPALQEYLPQYCEQPLFFTLQYVIAMAERNKRNQGKISAWFRETFQNQVKLKDLMNCSGTLRQLIMTDESLGFHILNDPLHMV